MEKKHWPLSRSICPTSSFQTSWCRKWEETNCVISWRTTSRHHISPSSCSQHWIPTRISSRGCKAERMNILWNPSISVYCGQTLPTCWLTGHCCATNMPAWTWTTRRTIRIASTAPTTWTGNSLQPSKRASKTIWTTQASTSTCSATCWI